MRTVLALMAFGGLVVAVVATTYATRTPAETSSKADPSPPRLELATFGNGCFWCTEAVFQQLKGVHSVRSGYTGGMTANPTYKDICTGTTGHAEVVRIEFDPAVISYKELLEIFWHTHDPTTLNRQGNDVGTQYRSAVFYHSDGQKDLAQRGKKALDEARIFSGPIVTEIVPAGEFYPAEDYHQNFFNDNQRNPYCHFVIRPKLAKLQEVFREKLKS